MSKRSRRSKRYNIPQVVPGISVPFAQHASGAHVSSVQHVTPSILRHEETTVLVEQDSAQPSIQTSHEYIRAGKRRRVDDGEPDNVEISALGPCAEDEDEVDELNDQVRFRASLYYIKVVTRRCRLPTLTWSNLKKFTRKFRLLF